MRFFENGVQWCRLSFPPGNYYKLIFPPGLELQELHKRNKQHVQGEVIWQIRCNQATLIFYRKADTIPTRTSSFGSQHRACSGVCAFA